MLVASGTIVYPPFLPQQNDLKGYPSQSVECSLGYPALLYGSNKLK